MSSNLKRVSLQRKMNNKVQCFVCPRKCVIPPNSCGLCRSKKNLDGTLYEVNYGLVSSVALDPIEKKPFYHFYPGSWSYSIGTVGCNLKCEHCQNWQISQAEPERFLYLSKLFPAEAVAQAKQIGARSIAFTYNEPTVVSFEWVLETAKLAKREGISPLSVTNGYISEEALEELLPHLEGANVDVKAFSDDFYRGICKVPSMEPVKRTAEVLKKRGKLVEITYLIIPTLNDDEEEIRKFSRWVLNELGPDVPVHFSRYHPMYKMRIKATPPETVRRARKLAIEEGLKYVYTGNLVGDDGENTFCPNCGRVVVRRYGFEVLKCNLTEGNRCKYCGEKIDIIGRCEIERRWPSIVL